MRVGFNSWVLGNQGFSIEETASKLIGLGANAIELSFPIPEVLLGFKITNELKKILGLFDYVSIHTPISMIENLRYRDDPFTNEIIAKLKFLVSELSVSAIIMHPSDVVDFDFLEKTGLPILFENMDSQKGSFKSVEDFGSLIDKYSFNFTLDVEHAFENDPSGKLTKDLVEMFGDRLKEVHISGAIKDKDIKEINHCPLKDSNHRGKLLEALRGLKHIPIILEVEAAEDFEETIKGELNYVKDALK